MILNELGMKEEMAVMLKRKFLILENASLVVSSVAIVKKAAKKIAVFRYLRKLELPLCKKLCI